MRHLRFVPVDAVTSSQFWNSEPLVFAPTYYSASAWKIHGSQDGGSLGLSDDVDLLRGVGVSMEQQRDSRYQPTHIYISHLDCLELYYEV